ncbi:MAG TPA: thiamine diphosphokinase [Acidimicrobiia bacterium]|nr:thiamine diphosphokinase [Acidimicrobiia bacterium]
MADLAFRRAVIFAGGDAPPSVVGTVLPRDAVVIGADSGVDVAWSLGRTVDIAVGDFDSIDPSILNRTEAAGATILRHPRDKDATDLELALDTAMTLRMDAATVVGGHGGRVDHFIANCALLTSDRYAGLAVDAYFDIAHLQVVRSHVLLTGNAGDLITLLAVGGPADGVRTTGLRFPLDDETLHPGSTRGVSNEMLGTEATVAVAHGCVLTIQPDALAHAEPAPDARPGS